MANKSYRGIFLDPIDSRVKKALEQRESVEASRAQSGFADSRDEFNREIQKLAWCKLLSNARGSGITQQITYENQMFMGHLTPGAKSSQVSIADITSGFKKRDTFNTGDYNLSDRNRPRPGIGSVSVLNKGQLGSIRQATIDFFVWTEEDLKLMEKLYMIPGITCLLEWGWSDYNGTTIKDSDYGQGPGEMNRVQRNMIRKSVGQDGKAGSYDGMLGVITKFNWSVSSNGGYQCQTTLIAPNSLIGELNTKSSNYKMQRKLIDTSKGKLVKKTGGAEETETEEPEAPSLLSQMQDTQPVFEELVDGITPTQENADITFSTGSIDMFNDIEGILSYVEGTSDLMTKQNEDVSAGEAYDMGSRYNTATGILMASAAALDVGPFDNEESTYQWLAAEYDFRNYNDFFAQSVMSPARIAYLTQKFEGASVNSFLYMPKPSLHPRGGEIKSNTQVKNWVGNEYGFKGYTYGFTTYLPTGIEGFYDLINGIEKISFVSWRFIEDVLLASIKEMKDPKSGRPLFKVKSVHESENDSSLIESNKCVNHKYITSTDQNICFLPGQHFTENLKRETKLALQAAGPSALPGLNSHIWSEEKMNWVYDAPPDGNAPSLPYPSYSDRWGDKHCVDKPGSSKALPSLIVGEIGNRVNASTGKSEGTANSIHVDVFTADSNNFTEGYIRNIMVNSDFITETFNNSDTIKDFVKSLLDGINRACGSPWDFQLQANPSVPDTLSVVDVNWSGKSKKDLAFKFKPNTYKSIVKNVSLTSKLPNEMQAMAFIAATRKDKRGGKTEGAGYTSYSYGLYDKYAGHVSEEEDHREKTLTEALLFTSENLTLGQKFLLKNFELSTKVGYGDDLKSQSQNLLSQYLEDNASAEIGNELARRPLIPLELSLSLDGISGVYMGNSINISKASEGGILPNRYDGKTLFQVTDVTHTLKSFSWDTELKGLMRMISY